MCREGVDLVTLKVALKHSSDRIRQETDHLRQWSALSANVNLDQVAETLHDALDRLAEAEGLVERCVRELAELQVQPSGQGGGVTITPI